MDVELGDYTLVLWRGGCGPRVVEPLLDPDDFENCLPRYWDHVTDCFSSMTAAGIVIGDSLLGPLPRPFVAFTHVEDLSVEHVQAIACIMRLLERDYSARAELAYATTYGALPPVVITAVTTDKHAVDRLYEIAEWYAWHGRIDQVRAVSVLDAILKALGYNNFRPPHEE